MIYLFLCIAFESLIALTFKYYHSRGWSGRIITIINYMVATIICLAVTIKNNLFSVFNNQTLNCTLTAIRGNFAGMHTDLGDASVAIFLGMLAGAFFLAGILTLQKSTKKNGASISNMFKNLSVFLSLLLSIIIWNEIPNVGQWVGITGIVVSIVIAFSGNGKFKIDGILLLLFITSGVRYLSFKLYSFYGGQKFQYLFYLITFAISLIIYTIYILAVYRPKHRHERFRPNCGELICGTLVGASNALAGFFTQSALRSLPTNVAYPTQSVAGMIIIALLSFIIFKEKLTKNQYAALFLSAVSVVLVNL